MLLIQITLCQIYFYPRPPRGGRHGQLIGLGDKVSISIHALREEGDVTDDGMVTIDAYFYPRPPRGGRRPAPARPRRTAQFLSTPSARRATCDFGLVPVVFLFLSTPSARRATGYTAGAADR